MCGRFSLTVEEVEINERFAIEGSSEVPYIPRFNGAPGQRMPIIINSRPRILSYYKWGLIPSWSRDASIAYKMINARSETVQEKVSFKVPLRSRRCLVPADGFYEWKRGPYKDKTPYRIVMNDKSLFAMAGLWETWRSPEKQIVNTFTILTTSANEMMNGIHDRMPVILPPEIEDLWLYSPDIDALMPWLKPYPSELMNAYPVSKRVNFVGNDDASLLEEV